MALTFTALHPKNMPDRPFALYSILFDNSYAANGEPVTAANFGLDRTIDAIIFGPAVDSSGNYLTCHFDASTSKIRVFNPVGGTAAAPTTIAQPVATVVPDAGAVTVTGSAAKPTLTATSTPGAGKEVPSTADLSGYTVQAVIFGS